MEKGVRSESKETKVRAFYSGFALVLKLVNPRLVTTYSGKWANFVTFLVKDVHRIQNVTVSYN